jgi:hypothetical protein
VGDTFVGLVQFEIVDFALFESDFLVFGARFGNVTSLELGHNKFGNNIIIGTT